jgi:hypothetical protein
MTIRTTAPLAAAVGLVAVTADGVRKLPELLITLPPYVVRQLDEARHTALARYSELARHGQDVLSGRHEHGTAPEALTELLEKVEEARPVAVEDSVAGLAEPTDLAGDPAGDLAVDTAVDTAVHEPATPEPVAPTPIGLTAPVEIPEDVLDEVAQLTPGAELAHAELPLADFDHLTVPQLRGRLRSLELPQLVQLRDYEQAHGHRLPVLTLLDNRIAKLTADRP